MEKILVSAVLSIHNRSRLFRRALDGYEWQSMPPEKWEIVLVDDGSTEDLSLCYRHLIGKINLTHVLMDHTRHPVFKELNPGWTPGQPKRWYHTPAISINLGSALSLGKTICLCHPEILHAPTNFQLAHDELEKEKLFIFGRTYIGTPRLNQKLTSLHDGGKSWTGDGWDSCHAAVADPVNSSAVLDETQLYWYTSFLPRAAVTAVHGVDFRYLRGVAAEDDDFRERVYAAGWEPVHRRKVVGVHQYHEDETEGHRRRESEAWKTGLETNRAVYSERRSNGFPKLVNEGYDWTGVETFVRSIEYKVGSTKPVVSSEVP